jgi:hypothetical protein
VFTTAFSAENSPSMGELALQKPESLEGASNERLVDLISNAEVDRRGASVRFSFPVLLGGLALNQGKCSVIGRDENGSHGVTV